MSSPTQAKSAAASPSNGQPAASGDHREQRLDSFLADLGELTSGKWQQRAEKLAARRRPRSLRKVFAGSKQHPLAWSVRQIAPAEAVSEMQSLLHLRRHPRSTERAPVAVTRPAMAGRRRQVGSLCGMGRRLSGVGPRAATTGGSAAFGRLATAIYVSVADGGRCHGQILV